MATRNRTAITITELVACLAIIFLLGSLLLVGLQSIRSSVRRTSCASNLRQIGMALQNYHATYNFFPAGSTPNSGLCPFVAILPYIEQRTLYDSIDFSTCNIFNMGAISRVQVPTYRCPAAMDLASARTDYGMNRGTTITPNRNSPWLVEEQAWPSLRTFSRGSSNTALLAEICQRTGKSQKGQFYFLQATQVDTIEQERVFLNDCNNASFSYNSIMDNGFLWIGGGTANYFHILTPNSRSCSNADNWSKSLATSASMHENGVNVLFADSRVEFVNESISLDPWMNYGTK